MLRKTARRGRVAVPLRDRRIRLWRFWRAALRERAWAMGWFVLLRLRGPLRTRRDAYFLPPILPALPALRRTISPAYRTPLPLYGSGLRVARTWAATRPTSSLSIPTTARRTGVSTSKLMPSGGWISTGWLYPRLSWRLLPTFWAR